MRRDPRGVAHRRDSREREDFRSPYYHEGSRGGHYSPHRRAHNEEGRYPAAAPRPQRARHDEGAASPSKREAPKRAAAGNRGSERREICPLLMRVSGADGRHS